jgi:Acetyltransferases
MLTIVKWGAEHRPEMLALERICFPTDYWKSEDWDDLLSDGRAVYYALTDGERQAGCVYIYNWQGKDDYVKLMNLAIHPDWRGRGLARRLLHHVAAEMEPLGMRRFCGETRFSNAAMRRVFESCGYRLDRIEEHYFTDPDESACKYVLRL